MAGSGVVLLKFSLAEGTNGQVAAQFDGRPELPSKPNLFEKGALRLRAKTDFVRDGLLYNQQGQTTAWFDDQWNWNAARQRLIAKLSVSNAATLAVVTRPIGILQCLR